MAKFKKGDLLEHVNLSEKEEIIIMIVGTSFKKGYKILWVINTTMPALYIVGKVDHMEKYLVEKCFRKIEQ